MKIADFAIQTTPPDSYGVGYVGLYANNSGILVTKTAAGVIAQVGTVLTGSPTAIANTGGSAMIASGTTVFGGNGSTRATGLANPALWISVNVNGGTYYLPAYS